MGNVSSDVFPDGAAIECALPWGPTIRGERWGSGSGLVLFLHEPGADLDAWQGLPRALAHLVPIEAVAFDLPGHGLSDDPWDPRLMPDLLRLLTERRDLEHGIVLATAGEIAGPAFDLAASLPLAGLIALSPTSPGTSPPRSPRVPKLLVASAGAANDVHNARGIASAVGGWAIVTGIPVVEMGTGLLRSAWAGRVREEIAGFVRDCLRSRRLGTSAPSWTPPATIEGRETQLRDRLDRHAQRNSPS